MQYIIQSKFLKYFFSGVNLIDNLGSKEIKVNQKVGLNMTYDHPPKIYVF